jgi:hypothetical protein
MVDCMNCWCIIGVNCSLCVAWDVGKESQFAYLKINRRYYVPSLANRGK